VSHYFTLYPQAVNNLIPQGWTFEGVACYVYGTQQNGAGQLYEVHRPDIADTYYGTDTQVLSAEIDYHYQQPGPSCFVFFQQDPNSPLPLTPLYRLSSFSVATPGEHFLTIDEQERSGLLSEGWQDDGIACWVFSNNTPNGAAPWYRLSR
jgi:hypothetical protein